MKRPCELARTVVMGTPSRPQALRYRQDPLPARKSMAAHVIESDKSFALIMQMSSIVDRPQPVRNTFQDTLARPRQATEAANKQNQALQRQTRMASSVHCFGTLWQRAHQRGAEVAP